MEQCALSQRSSEARQMMTDYRIGPMTRRCAVTGRELQPGERFYTALVDEDGNLVRHDYAPEAWQGPPAGAFSFWAGKVPTATGATKPRFDDDLLEECFQRLQAQDDPAKANFRYVVALLLIRRKRYHFERSTIEEETEWLVLRHPRTGQQVRVLNPRLDDEQMQQTQKEVFEVLGWS